MKLQTLAGRAVMPKTNGGLTPQERKAAQVFAATGSVTEAGKAAGYSHPTISASRTLARPAVAAEVARLQQERITNEILPLAVDVHARVLRDKRTAGGTLIQAVKLAYDRALGTGAPDGKEPHEMTADEIATALQSLKREASNRAAPVIDAAPLTPSVLD